MFTIFYNIFFESSFYKLYFYELTYFIIPDVFTYKQIIKLVIISYQTY